MNTRLRKLSPTVMWSNYRIGFVVIIVVIYWAGAMIKKLYNLLAKG